MGGFDFNGVSGLLTAGAALLGAYAATFRATSGKRSERRQQEAANALTADDQTNRHYRDLINDLNVQIDRKDTEIARLQSSAELAEQQRVRERLEHRAELSQYREDFQVLRQVVRNEVARAAADDDIDAIGPPGTPAAIEHHLEDPEAP